MRAEGASASLVVGATACAGGGLAVAIALPLVCVRDEDAAAEMRGALLLEAVGALAHADAGYGRGIRTEEDREERSEGRRKGRHDDGVDRREEGEEKLDLADCDRIGGSDKGSDVKPLAGVGAPASTPVPVPLLSGATLHESVSQPSSQSLPRQPSSQPQVSTRERANARASERTRGHTRGR